MSIQKRIKIHDRVDPHNPICSYCGCGLVDLKSRDLDPEGIRNDMFCSGCQTYYACTKAAIYPIAKQTEEPPEIQLEQYVIRCEEGYYQRYGYSHDGPNGSSYVFKCVQDISKAKIFHKINHARGVVTKVCQDNSSIKPPKILVLTLTAVEVLDETPRLEKKREEHKKLLKKQEERQQEYLVKQAEYELKKAQDKFDKLKGNK